MTERWLYRRTIIGTRISSEGRAPSPAADSVFSDSKPRSSVAH